MWCEILLHFGLSELVLLSRLSKTWYQQTTINIGPSHTNDTTTKIYSTWLLNGVSFDIHRNILKTDSQFYNMFHGNRRWFDFYRKMYNNNIVIDIMNNKIAKVHKKQFFIKNILPLIAIECDRYLLRIKYCQKQDIFTLNTRDSRYCMSSSRISMKASINNKGNFGWYNKDKSYKTQILLKHIKYQVEKMINNQKKAKMYQDQSYNIACVLRLLNHIAGLINQLKKQFIGISECIGNDINRKKYPYKSEHETAGIYLQLFEVFNYFNCVALRDKSDAIRSKQRTCNMHVQRTKQSNIYKYYTIELVFKLILCTFGDKIDLITDSDVKLDYGSERFIEFYHKHSKNKYSGISTTNNKYQCFGHDWFNFTKQLMSCNRDSLLFSCDWYDPFACYSISKQMEESEAKTPGFDAAYMAQWRFNSVQTKEDYKIFEQASIWQQQPKYFLPMTRFNHLQTYKLCCLNKIDYEYYNTIGIYRNGIILTMYILSNSKTNIKIKNVHSENRVTSCDDNTCDKCNTVIKTMLRKLVFFDTKGKIAPQRLTRNLYRSELGASLHVFQTAHFSFVSAMFLIEYELSLKCVNKKYGYYFVKQIKDARFKRKDSHQMFIDKIKAIRKSEIGKTFDGMVAEALLVYKQILFNSKECNIINNKKIVRNGYRMRCVVKQVVKRRFLVIDNQICIHAE